MKRLAMITAAATLVLGVGTISASAACSNDVSTETVLGAGAGAAVGGIASNSIGGALIGGVAGGLIGNTIGHANNREDCRRAANNRRAVRPERSQNYYLDREGRRHYYYR